MQDIDNNHPIPPVGGGIAAKAAAAGRCVFGMFARTESQLKAAQAIAREAAHQAALQRQRVRRYLDNIRAGHIQTAEQAALLREIAVAQLRHGRGKVARGFRGFHHDSMTGEAKSARDAAIHRVLDKMAQPSEWATDIEMAAVFEAFDTHADDNLHGAIKGRKIRIHTPGRKPFTLDGKGEPVYFYNNHVHWEKADANGETSYTVGDGSCMYHAIAQVAAEEMGVTPKPVLTTSAQIYEPVAVAPAIGPAEIGLAIDAAVAAVEQESKQQTQTIAAAEADSNEDHAAFSHQKLLYSQITGSGLPSEAEISAEELRYLALSPKEQAQYDNDHTVALNSLYNEVEETHTAAGGLRI